MDESQSYDSNLGFKWNQLDPLTPTEIQHRGCFYICCITRRTIPERTVWHGWGSEATPMRTRIETALADEGGKGGREREGGDLPEHFVVAFGLADLGEEALEELVLVGIRRRHGGRAKGGRSGRTTRRNERARRVERESHGEGRDGSRWRNGRSRFLVLGRYQRHAGPGGRRPAHMYSSAQIGDGNVLSWTFWMAQSSVGRKRPKSSTKRSKQTPFISYTSKMTVCCIGCKKKK